MITTSPTRAASGEIDLQVESRVRQYLGDDGYAQALAPLDQPCGLPNSAFWSEDWLALEQERIFRRNWIFAAADGELDGPGAMKPLEVAGTPLFLVKGRDGKVRAFHNVCRHRGTQLVTAPCRQATITCPYHAWSYDLQGQLRRRPHFNGPDQHEAVAPGEAPELYLYAIRCESWNGCHFVDLSGTAAPLADWLAPLMARTRAYDLTPIRWIGKKSYRIKSNWKLVLENYMEGYHVFAAHPRLIAHAPMNVRWSGEWIGHVFYNDYVAPQVTVGRGDALPHFPGLTPEDTRRGLWFACLPNFAVEVYADQFVVLAPFPYGPDETLEELHFFVIGDEAAQGSRYAVARQELMDMWHDLNLEDVSLLERLQQGRRSPAFDGARLSPAWDGPVRELSQQVLQSILRP